MSSLIHQKVGVFIDAENVEISGYDIYGGRTNYAQLIEDMGDREITRIIYYKPIHKTISDEFRKFWTSMGGEIKQPVKNADAWLTIDAVTLSEKLDVVALIGGDKDYLPLIWYLKNRGCRVEVWSYPETASEMIKQAADLFVPMGDRFTIIDRPKGRVTRRVTRRVEKPE
ncbi:MAG: NYN domain-containing protein [Nitrospinae bacterium]|nr:NYN domain-containing protein [Nitrospinota bacterium]MBF0635146.1 NYN domain-containing protein [Nitrospinota bacterium]